VAKQRIVAINIPSHIAEPADGAPYADCSANVSHKNAPGAISAMAFDVRPVRPSVGFIPAFSVPGVSLATQHAPFSAAQKHVWTEIVDSHTYGHLTELAGHPCLVRK
jgi:hypothetical protein